MKNLLVATLCSLLLLVLAALSAPALAVMPEQQKTLDEIESRLDQGQRIDALLWQASFAADKFYGWYQRAKDPYSKTSALLLMHRHGDPNLNKAVADGLFSDEQHVRWMAIDLVGSAKDEPRAVEAIRRELASDDTEMRLMAVKGLACVPAAIAAMPEKARECARSNDPVVRHYFLAFVGKDSRIYSQTRMTFGKGDTSSDDVAYKVVAPLLLEAAQSDDPANVIDAGISLAWLGLLENRTYVTADQTAAVLAKLMADLGSENVELSGAAELALLPQNGEPAMKALCDALASDNMLLRVRAADTLRKKNEKFDVSALADVIAKGPEDAQLGVCATLTRVQTAECVPVLAAALKSSHANVRQAAVYALEAVETPEAADALAEALSHDDANVRMRAAVALGRRRNPDGAQQRIAAALHQCATRDRDENVRDAARVADAVVRRADLASVLALAEPLKKVLNTLDPTDLRKAGGKPTTLANGVAQVGSQKQLFLDDLVLDDLGGATRLLHKFQKDPRNPILEQRYPWELMGTVMGTLPVYRDPDTGLFVGWYTSTDFMAANRGTPQWRRVPLIAYSEDGIHWRRPNLGDIAFDDARGTDHVVKQYNGTKANNLVGRVGSVIVNFDTSDADKRYMSYGLSGSSLTISFSPDGYTRWTEPVKVTGIGGDVVTMGPDFVTKGYFGFLKMRLGRWSRRAAVAAYGQDPLKLQKDGPWVITGFDDDRGAPARIAAVAQTVDGIQPEYMHAQMYAVTPFTYEGFYMGLPVRFDVSGGGPSNLDGRTDLCLVASRSWNAKDGWIIPGGTGAQVRYGPKTLQETQEKLPAMWPILDLGKWGEWDSTQHYGPSNLVIADDRIVLYYTGAPFGHEPPGGRSDWRGRNYYRAAVGRATLRLDGFVSLHADGTEVTVTTKPLVFEGKELAVNADCPKGSLGVELTDAEGKPLPGFTREDCDVFTGDGIHQVVTWKGKSDVSGLAGKTLHLMFHLRNGDLYAFQFRK